MLWRFQQHIVSLLHGISYIYIALLVLVHSNAVMLSTYVHVSFTMHPPNIGSVNLNCLLTTLTDLMFSMQKFSQQKFHNEHI